MDEGSSKLFAGGSAIDFEQTPPRMDVKFPILGFLKEAEATGYDLKNRFRDPVGFFYRVSDGSIYPALKKLARDGLVTLRSERQGRRTRKVYAITTKGREHFRRMLHEPAQPLFVFDESQGRFISRIRSRKLRLSIWSVPGVTMKPAALSWRGWWMIC